MELLQNRRYKIGDIIPDSYFHEIRMQIECIVDVCQEGEISVCEAENVIHEELFCCFDYQYKLWEELEYLNNSVNKLDNDIEERAEEIKLKTWEEGIRFDSLSAEEQATLKDIGKKWQLSDREKALEDMEKYNDFLIEAQDKLREIFESDDYQRKRKTKIKQQIIKNGLTPSHEKADNINEQASETSLIEQYMNFLVVRFPTFAMDYPLLLNNGFLKKAEKGFRWLKSNQSLAEYFKSINPSKTRRIPWANIENIFDKKNLKNSASTNGRGTKGNSKDFEKWLEIKKSLADK